MDYKSKYLKYKLKYLKLKGGGEYQNLIELFINITGPQSKIDDIFKNRTPFHIDKYKDYTLNNLLKEMNLDFMKIKKLFISNSNTFLIESENIKTSNELDISYMLNEKKDLDNMHQYIVPQKDLNKIFRDLNGIFHVNNTKSPTKYTENKINPFKEENNKRTYINIELYPEMGEEQSNIYTIKYLTNNEDNQHDFNKPHDNLLTSKTKYNDFIDNMTIQDHDMINRYKALEKKKQEPEEEPKEEEPEEEEEEEEEETEETFLIIKIKGPKSQIDKIFIKNDYSLRYSMIKVAKILEKLRIKFTDIKRLVISNSHEEISLNEKPHPMKYYISPLYKLNFMLSLINGVFNKKNQSTFDEAKKIDPFKNNIYINIELYPNKTEETKEITLKEISVIYTLKDKINFEKSHEKVFTEPDGFLQNMNTIIRDNIKNFRKVEEAKKTATEITETQFALNTRNADELIRATSPSFLGEAVGAMKEMATGFVS